MPVGTKTANEIGIHDMSGNVWEWIFELSNNSYLRFRGGGLNMRENFGALANRGFGYIPDERSSAFGFRLARNAP